MPFHHFRKIYYADVATGASFSDSWTSDNAYTIHRIFIVEKTGRALYNTPLTMRKEDYVFIRDEVPAYLLGPDIQVSPVLNIPIAKGETLYWEGKNDEGVSIGIYIILELHK